MRPVSSLSWQPSRFSELPGIIEVKEGELIIHDHDQLTPEQRRSIRKIRAMTIGRTRDGREIESIEVELWDKVHALELLARHHRLLGNDAPTSRQTIQVYMDLGSERPRFAGDQ